MKTLTLTAGILIGAVALVGCQEQRITVPEAAVPPGSSAHARLLQPEQLEPPCGTVMTVALRDAAGNQVGQAEVWTGETMAYVRFTAQQGWEFTEVRVGGARQPGQFPRTGGIVDPSRFPFGGAVAPPQSEVVVEAMYIGNPYGIGQEDQVVLAAFARLRPVGGGSEITAWLEGTAFQPGQHAMYFQFVLPECPTVQSSTITAGRAHSCGLTASGYAYCWGQNQFGQLGIGSWGANQLMPVAVVAPMEGDDPLVFTGISAGNSHTCGVTRDHHVYCWGYNGNAGIGDGTTVQRVRPTLVGGGIAFNTITVAHSHACGVTTESEAYCWGVNSFGQLGDGTTEARLVPTAVLTEERFAAIAAGTWHTCALSMGEEAFCWGLNNTGNLGDGTTVNRPTPTAVVGGLRFATVTVGERHSCAITPQNDGYCWGGNFHGQVGDGSSFPRPNRTEPTTIVGGLRFTAISAGYSHTCGVATDERAYCWGLGQSGQLGDGTTTASRSVPGPVAGTESFSIVSGGYQHTCALTTDNAAYCWGSNGNGRLGDGTTEQRLVPTPVSGWGGLAAAPFVGHTLYALLAEIASHSSRTAG